MSSKETIEMQVDQLMTRIRKQVEATNGIENFGKLLKEVKDENFARIVIKEIHQFMDEFNIIAGEVDKLSNRAVISKILNYNFIKPERFFNDSRRISARYIKMNRRLVNNYPEKHYQFWIIGNDNRLGNVIDELVSKNNKLPDILTGVTPDEAMEESRKVILIWNHMPMVVKAILQTKKRGLGMDTNSKRFSQKNIENNEEN